MTVTVSNNGLWIIKMSIIWGPIKQYLNWVHFPVTQHHAKMGLRWVCLNMFPCAPVKRELTAAIQLHAGILTERLGMRHINKVCPMAADSGAERAALVWSLWFASLWRSRHNFFRNIVNSCCEFKISWKVNDRDMLTWSNLEKCRNSYTSPKLSMGVAKCSRITPGINVFKQKGCTLQTLVCHQGTLSIFSSTASVCLVFDQASKHCLVICVAVG